MTSTSRASAMNCHRLRGIPLPLRFHPTSGQRRFPCGAQIPHPAAVYSSAHLPLTFPDVQRGQACRATAPSLLALLFFTSIPAPLSLFRGTSTLFFLIKACLSFYAHGMPSLLLGLSHGFPPFCLDDRDLLDQAQMSHERLEHRSGTVTAAVSAFWVISRCFLSTFET